MLRRADASTPLPLLLAVDGLFDARGSARIFPAHFAKGGAGGFLLLQRGERLAEPQQGVRGFCRAIELGGHAEERFGRVTIELALEETFAKPELRLRNQGIARISLDEVAHGFLCKRIVLALHVANAEVELVPRRRR